MIMEYFKTASDKYLADRYVIEHLGQCIHCATKESSQFERLSAGDEVVIASAKCLSRNPINLLIAITELTHRGVHVHFAKEQCAFCGKCPEATHLTLEKVLTLLMGLSHSHPSQSQTMTTKFGINTQGWAGCDPICYRQSNCLNNRHQPFDVKRQGMEQ